MCGRRRPRSGIAGRMPAFLGRPGTAALRQSGEDGGAAPGAPGKNKRPPGETGGLLYPNIAHGPEGRATQGRRDASRGCAPGLVAAGAFLAGGLEDVLHLGHRVVAVELGDEVERDALRARGLTLAVVRAGAEAGVVHGLDHGEGAAVFLGLALRQAVELGDLRADEEHGGGVLARGHAGAAADALGGVHRAIGDFLGDRVDVRVDRGAGAHGDESAGLDDLVERGAVHDEVFHDREGARAPGLDGDGLAVLEVAHVQLAGGDAGQRAVGHAVDGHRAHAADAFAAVVVEGDGVAAGEDDLLVEQVHHLEEGGVLGDVRDLVVLELAFGAGLAPHAEGEGEIFSGHDVVPLKLLYAFIAYL